ncbi:hypothetical protein BsWGS_00891 [Bradybaena similaris]
MDDLDSWMKRYINKHRLKFIENMMTDLFINGFPGLQNYQMDRVKCIYRQSGYFQANAELIDYIVKIDDFSDKFINFCEKQGINQKLVRIVRAGLQEYHSRFGRLSVHNASQNLTSDRNDQHRERAFPSHASGNGDQTSVSTINSAQSRDLSQSDNEDRTNLIAACSNIENTNSGSVSHEIREEKTADGVDAACLINCLECTSNLEGAESTLEKPCPRPSYANGVSIEDNNLNDNNDRREHRHELEVSSSSSSSDNINLHSVDNESKTSSDLNILRNKTVPSCEKNMDKLQNEGTASVCDPNLDRRDSMEKTSHGDKVTFMAEHATRSDVNASNATKNLESWESVYLSSSDEEYLLPPHSLEIDSLKEIPKLPSNLDEPVQRIHSPEVTGNNDIRAGPLETSALAGDTFQRDGPSETPAVAGDTFQRDGPSETPAIAGDTFQKDGRLETSKAKFTVLSTGLSGVECQEDIDRFKTNMQMEKRIKNNLLSDESKNCEGAILEHTGSPSSLTESILSETKVKEVNEITGAVPQQQACEENLKNNVLSDGSKNCEGAILEHTGSPSSLTESILSETKVKEVNEITGAVPQQQACEENLKNNVLSDGSKNCEGAILELTGSPSSVPESILSETKVKEANEITEAVPQQQACEENLTQYDSDDFHSLHNTMGIYNGQESVGVVRAWAGGNSLHLSVNSFPASAYSESSEGFEFDALATEFLEVVSSDVESNNGSSDHVSEGSQSFERDIPTLQLPNTQIISSDIFSQNGGLDHNANISEPSQHSSENSSQECMQNNNSTPSNITVFVTQARRVIEMYFPELCIRL